MTATRFLPALACLCLVAACAAPPRNETASPVEASAVAAPRPAPVATTAQATAQPAATEEKDPVVCKNFAPIGTRFVRRGCLRKSQWEQAARDGRDAVERVQRNGLLSGNGSGG